MNKTAALAITCALLLAATSSAAYTLPRDSYQFGTYGYTLQVGECVGFYPLRGSDIMALHSGAITTSQGWTNYLQEVRFPLLDSCSPPIPGPRSGVVKLATNNEGAAGVYLYFDNASPLLQYKQDFDHGLKSRVDSSGELTDIDGQTLFILGRNYYINRATTTNESPSLFLDFIENIDGHIFVNEETRYYSVDGGHYTLTLDNIKDNGTAHVTISEHDGNTSSEGTFAAGEAYSLGGKWVVVEDINTTSQQATIVTGTHRFNLTDPDITDGKFGQQVCFDTCTTEVHPLIMGTINDGNATIGSLQLQLFSNTSVYVPANGSLQQELTNPGGAFGPDFDIAFLGLTQPATHNITFDPVSQDQYNLTFTNQLNNTYTIPYAFAGNNSSGRFGDENHTLVFWESNPDGTAAADEAADYNIGVGDYFITTTSANESVALQFTGVDENSSTITLTDLSSGASVDTDFSGALSSNAGLPANGTINAAHTFWLYEPVPGKYRLAVDLDGDGKLTDGGIVSIVTDGGGILKPADSTTYTGAWNATLTTPAANMVATGEVLHISLRFVAENGKYHIRMQDPVEGVFYVVNDTNVSELLGLDSYGASYEQTIAEEGSDSLGIAYPEVQVKPRVYGTDTWLEYQPSGFGIASAGVRSITKTSATLSVTTSVPAYCRYGTADVVNIVSLPYEFSTSDGLTQTAALTGLAPGTHYTYFYSCTDGFGTSTTTVPLTFTTAVAPRQVVSSGGGGGGGGSYRPPVVANTTNATNETAGATPPQQSPSENTTQGNETNEIVQPQAPPNPSKEEQESSGLTGAVVGAPEKTGWFDSVVKFFAGAFHWLFGVFS